MMSDVEGAPVCSNAQLASDCDGGEYSPTGGCGREDRMFLLSLPTCDFGMAVMTMPDMGDFREAVEMLGDRA